MTGPARAEQYTHGYHRSVVTAHSSRRASETAAFMLPLLKSPMRLLDFGCGPGTITVDLARHLLPDGSVLGIDRSEAVIEEARTRAAAAGVSNVSFELNSIYRTGYAAESFDAVYAHQVLQHLSEPPRALREAHRLLKQGGICGVREVDWGTSAVWPADERLLRFLDIYHQVAERNGSEADAGRRLKQWYLDAGFTELSVATSTWSFSETAGLNWWGRQWSERIVQSDLAKRALEYGIATQEELTGISQAWLEWTEAPGAFFTFVHTEVIGTKA